MIKIAGPLFRFFFEYRNIDQAISHSLSPLLNDEWWHMQSLLLPLCLLPILRARAREHLSLALFLSLSVSSCHSHHHSTPLHSTQHIYPTPPPPLHSTQPIYPTPPPPSSSDCCVAKMPVKTARRCWIPMHTIGKLVAGGGSSVIAPVTFPIFQPLYPHHPITSHHRQINHHHHFTSNSSPTSPQTPNSPNIKYPTLTLLLTPTLPQHLHSTIPLYHSHHYPHQPLCHRHHHFTYNSSPISPRNTFHSPLPLRT